MSDLLYGLMLKSGNDAAVAIAEHISGSEEVFADLMNETARSFGATNSHFVNSNGLHDEDHYTCVYDLYLIFSHAIEDETFRQLIQTASYTAYYTDASGNETSQTWTNTNKYLNGEVSQPDNVTVVGGKTGTTRAAGYCLVLLAQNENKEPVISIVMQSDGRNDLYSVMNQMLANFAK
jgi:D-alanyl-D-alanine carboxypeptidase (penicillin-binding protein 5/6)